MEENKQEPEPKETKPEEKKESSAAPPEPEKKNEGKDTGEPKSETLLDVRQRARQEVESQATGEAPPLPPEPKEEKPEEKVKTEPEKKEGSEKEPEPNEEEKLKAKIQKRIGKEVAKRKTLEEQIAEKDAEIERLRSERATPKESGKPSEGENKEPTDDEIKAALKKAREEGDVDFEFQILDYISERKAKREREEALKEINSNNKKSQERAQQWGEIVQDYSVVDDDGNEIKDHPLNLNNENSRLYKTAKALYADENLRKERYSRGSEMENIRRAVSDAYIELTKMGVGLRKEEKPKDDKPSVKERMKKSLAEPGAAQEEPTEPSGPPKPKNEEEKVQDEVVNRMKFRREREAVPI